MTVAEIGRRMDGLDLWSEVAPYHWVLKPHGTALPYFCVIVKGDGGLLKARVLLLEGWQTFQDFVRMRIDGNFGFYSSPIEFPHYELVIMSNGEDCRLFRYDTGYMPTVVTGAGEKLCERMLWEVFGVMMRMETDHKLSLKFAPERSIFARVEGADGIWRDEPLRIPDARPHIEKISFSKEDLMRAKDLPFASEEAIELDFRLIPGAVTNDKRPRCIYSLVAIDSKSGERIMFDSLAIGADMGLRGLWESMPARFLRHILARGRVPGEVKILTQRMFRMIRPLCIHLPFKLSLHDKLPRLEAAIPKKA